LRAITDDDDSICGLNNFHNLNNSPRVQQESLTHSLTQLVRQDSRLPFILAKSSRAKTKARV